MIGVIDYGMGNLYSVSKSLERVGVPYFVSEKPEELKEADAFILLGSRFIWRRDGQFALHEA